MDLLARFWGKDYSLGLGEVELGLPDKAELCLRLAADARGVGWVGHALDAVDRHDLEARVAVGVEVVGADHPDEALGLVHLGPDLIAGGHAAVGVVDRAADCSHQRVGRVVSLHGVAAEVVRAGELLAERVNRGLGPGDLGSVGACRGRADPDLVAGRLVDAVGGLDAVTAAEWHVPAEVFHLLARDADVLVVGAAYINALSAGVLEAEQDRLPVAGGCLLVLRVLGGTAELLELDFKGAGDSDTEYGAVVQDAAAAAVQSLVGA